MYVYDLTLTYFQQKSPQTMILSGLFSEATAPCTNYIASCFGYQILNKPLHQMTKYESNELCPTIYDYCNIEFKRIHSATSG
jgi:hypothetical protein